VRLSREGGGVAVRVRGSPGAELPDGLSLRARLLRGNRAEAEIPLLQEGPGTWAGFFPDAGRGLVRVLAIRDPEGAVAGEGCLSVGDGPETRRLGPDREALRALCAGGGRLWDSPGEFAPGPAAGSGRGLARAGWIPTILGACCFVGAAFFRRRA
jgi:hypothetical protein